MKNIYNFLSKYMHIYSPIKNHKIKFRILIENYFLFILIFIGLN